jgi:1-deoxy-D-xylulose 5-phosphate reductoisomerase
MGRTRFVDHRGKKVLVLDYSGIREPAEALAAIEESKREVVRHPHKSLRVLTDSTGSHYDTAVVQALKELAAHDEPYVIASAVVGVVGLKKVVLTAVNLFSKRKITMFDSREQALDWLVAQ